MLQGAAEVVERWPQRIRTSFSINSFSRLARSCCRSRLAATAVCSGKPPSIPGASQLSDFHRIWRVHKPYDRVTSFVQNRLPRGAEGQNRGGGGGSRIPYNNEDDSYSFPTNDSNSVVWLDLTFVALPHGWTGIRADALIGSCPCVHH